MDKKAELTINTLDAPDEAPNYVPSEKEDSSMVQWAQKEIERAGLFKEDSDYGGMIGQALMEHIRLFSKQGHSGFSANITRAALNNLLAYKPLTPVTSDPAEWMEVTDNIWQNCRYATKFSTDKGKTWYDIDKPLRFRSLRRKLGLRQFAP